MDSLAVLPLENLSGDPNQEVFANGMTEALITELSRLKALTKVISRTSVMQYKGTKKPIRQIAGELGVDALIEGSALRDGNRVRISVKVIDAATDTPVWTNSFDRDYKDILALHKEVARAIAQEVKAALSPEEAATLATAGTVNPEAYDYFLRGNDYALRRRRELDLRVAIEMYEKAIGSDPRFAPAYAMLSAVHSEMWWLYYDRTEKCLSGAKAAADKSLELQPDLSDAHTALGYYYYWCRLDFDQALREFTTAQRTRPNDVMISSGIGLVFRRQGKMEEAAANLSKAAELSPIAIEPAEQAAITYACMRNLEEAKRYYDRVIALQPDRPEPFAGKALQILRLAGDIPQARAVIESAGRLGLDNAAAMEYVRDLLDLYNGTVQNATQRILSGSRAPAPPAPEIRKTLLRAQIFGQAGKPGVQKIYYESVVKVVTARLKQRPEEAYSHSALGIAYAGLGRKQDAIREGKTAVELLPLGKDALSGFDQLYDLARIYAMVGENDGAARLLEQLMSIPGNVGIGALRLDPVWMPLRAHPRFRELTKKLEERSWN